MIPWRRNTHFTPAEKAKAFALREAGMTRREIAIEMQRTLGSIDAMFHRYLPKEQRRRYQRKKVAAFRKNSSAIPNHRR